MKTIYHAADSRGNANHGWLKSRHTFSFANYYNPERMGFGVLRVINDDFVIGGQGFGKHSHRDMEIMGTIMTPNEFNQVLSPNADDAGVWIHQDAWFSMGEFDEGVTQTYQLNNPNNGVYIFVIAGTVVIDGNILFTRDGLGVWDTKHFTMEVKEAAKVLLMEVPLSM